MASKSKKKNVRKTNKTTKTAKRQVSESTQNTSYDEVILWIALAVSILLFVSNFGIGGRIGNAVSSFFFGLFGLLSYLFPVLFFLMVSFGVSNKGQRIAAVKIIAAVLLFVSLCTMVQMFSNNTAVYSAKTAFQNGFESKRGGGALGGLFELLLCPNFGKVGAFVIVFVAIIISIVLLTGRSVMGGVKSGSKKIYDNTKEGAMRRKEAHAKRVEEETANRRMDRHGQGVSTDTLLTPSSEDKIAKSIREMQDESNMATPEVKSKRRVSLFSKKDTKQTDDMTEIAQDEKPLPEINTDFDALFSEENDYDGLSNGTNGFEKMDLFAGEEPAANNSYTNEPLANDSFAQKSSASSAFANEPFASESSASGTFTNETPAKESFTNSSFMDSGVTGSAGHADTLSEESAATKSRTTKQTAASKDEGIAEVANEIHFSAEEKKHPYRFPSVNLLKKPDRAHAGDSKQYLRETAAKLEQTLRTFGVNVTVKNVSCGPSVTRYEIQPEMGVKVSKIVSLADDIKLNLAASDIRIEAPIPGKAAVGIEVPNKESVPVLFRELIEADAFHTNKSAICFGVGKDIGGNVIVADIAKMPHLLIAGATGSGKSVCINTIIMSILYHASPDDVKLIMIDPKVVELSVYNGIPHLLIPVVTDPKKAAGALNWAVAEMTDRYQKFATYNVRDIHGYNAKVASIEDIPGENKPEKMPQIVVIVDELADLMMVAPGDVEDAICRLAQLARACGIHLILATQRPSVNVITGLIKANMPSRIAFSVSSGVDSRTILDMNGAEKLLGKGDMLFYPQGYAKPLRVQGSFVSDKEVQAVVKDVIDKNGSGSNKSEMEEKVMSHLSADRGVTNASDGEEQDAYFTDAAKLIVGKDKASIGMLQRQFKIGFNRAARIMDQLEEAGIVGPEAGTKPREILMSEEQLENFLEQN